MAVVRWFVFSAVALSACGSSGPDSAADLDVAENAADSAASTSDGGSTGTATADQRREVGHQVLIDGAPTGDTWATALATNSNALTQLWREIGLSGDVPDVDFVEHVVVFFGPAESSSCRFGPLTGVAYDPDAERLFPILDFEDPIRDGEERACTADDNPHAIVVAIPRHELPDDDFDIWVERDDPPACCGSEVTPVGAGELTTFDPTDTSGSRSGR